MRRAFIAPPGMRLIVVDYSQLEVVILAHLIAVLFGDQDPLVQAVRSNADIHALGARRIFGDLAGDERVANAPIETFKTMPDLALLRDITKTGVYGKNYGKGPKGFASSFFLPDGSPLGEKRAHQLCDGLDQTYPGVPGYQRFVRDFITRYRYIISLFGRWYPLPGAADKKQGIRNKAWRAALNWPMQGGGQEVMALALIQVLACDLLKSLGFVLSLVVHDEIVGWAPEANAGAALALVEQHMVSVVDLLVPLRAKGHHGVNWAVAK